MRIDGHEDEDRTIDLARVMGAGAVPVSPRFTLADQNRLNRFSPGQLLSNRFLISRRRPPLRRLRLSQSHQVF